MWITPKKLPGYPQKVGISFPHCPQNTACYVDKLWKIDEFLVELIAINSTFSSYPQFLGITYPHSKRRLWIKNGLFGKLSTQHTYTYIELRSFPQSYPHTRWGIFIIRTYPQKVGISFPHYPQWMHPDMRIQDLSTKSGDKFSTLSTKHRLLCG
jgi:hypothetical protein